MTYQVDSYDDTQDPRKDSMITRPLVIYHGNCADGFAAAWIFNKYYPSGCDFHPGVYQKAPPSIAGREKVFFVDFSYKRQVVEQMMQENPFAHIKLIDHHKTALEDLSGLQAAGKISWYVDIERSGCMLAWDWLNQEFGLSVPKPQLLQYIQHRDLWKHINFPDHPLSAKTEAIQANVFSFPYDFETWSNLMNTDPDNLWIQGQSILRKHHKDIAELLPIVTRMMNIDGNRVPVANLPYTLASDAAHKLSEEYPFAACYFDTPEGRVFSLRSAEEGADVSTVAKVFGGGGHRHAAGFRVPFEVAYTFEIVPHVF